MRPALVGTTAAFVLLAAGACNGGSSDGDKVGSPTSLPPATVTATADPSPTARPPSPGATVAAATATAAPGATYTVQAGDSLSLVAEKFGTTVAELVALNGIEDPDLIFPGQVLQLPR